MMTAPLNSFSVSVRKTGKIRGGEGGKSEGERIWEDERKGRRRRWNRMREGRRRAWEREGLKREKGRGREEKGEGGEKMEKGVGRGIIQEWRMRKKGGEGKGKYYAKEEHED